MTDEVRLDLRLSPRVRYREVAGDLGVLIHLERGTIVTMNAQAARTLSLIAELGSRDAVVAAVAGRQAVPPAQAASDLDVFLAELREEGILQ
ncbi:MAG TPA: PqqD family protein [Thermoanaerobaculia bacterium]|nr:PqqD family protein [Thermoanaerobaculia bacterium]